MKKDDLQMVQIMESFAGKVVLVTGAGQGLGRALSETFASRGAVVAANNINPLSLDETLAHIIAVGGKVKDYSFDIARRMPVQALVSQVMEDWGRIDVLLNCAIVEPIVPVLDMDEWESIFWRLDGSSDQAGKQIGCIILLCL